MQHARGFAKTIRMVGSISGPDNAYLSTLLQGNQLKHQHKYKGKVRSTRQSPKCDVITWRYGVWSSYSRMARAIVTITETSVPDRVISTCSVWLTRWKTTQALPRKGHP